MVFVGELGDDWFWGCLVLRKFDSSARYQSFFFQVQIYSNFPRSQNIPQSKQPSPPLSHDKSNYQFSICSCTMGCLNVIAKVDMSLAITATIATSPKKTYHIHPMNQSLTKTTAHLMSFIRREFCSALNWNSPTK